MFDIDAMVRAGGILIVALIVFAESGLLIGFFLPGDTLLFGAGLLASQGEVEIVPLILATILAAIIGDNVGYSIGRRGGRRLFKKADGIIFRQEHLAVAEKFYEKHGGKTIILARFTPLVRTFAPLVAGISKMPRKVFFLYNVVGAVLWGAGMTLLGYHLGSRIPGLDHYIEYVLFGVVALSIILSLVHLLKDERIRKLLWKRIKRDILLNKK